MKISQNLLESTCKETILVTLPAFLLKQDFIARVFQQVSRNLLEILLYKKHLRALNLVYQYDREQSSEQLLSVYNGLTFNNDI